ncbi:peptide-methionine (S)-S-oxide reductase MsrA [Kordiimonas pumila]|uniref:Peptide methionine sulfoxide reductase MsrA n=1 Tax=Kordiimonas pumila TaxID=2161677 RepID=A0ABV7D8H9_9PROT|nr:peptide-methionine (S)-S-oxide reductase MsrA [Kordiimonas pumila]
MATATFGAGCFWGVEEVFRTTKGVIDTSVGYMGGHLNDPTYKDVCTDTTGHAEVVQVQFDPNIISYNTLLDLFFENHNPTQLNRQGPDYGTQYRSVIFCEDSEQTTLAEKKRAELIKAEKYDKPIVTVIEPVRTYWPAEEYHQKYLLRRGLSVCHI